MARCRLRDCNPPASEQSSTHRSPAVCSWHRARIWPWGPAEGPDLGSVRVTRHGGGRSRHPSRAIPAAGRVGSGDAVVGAARKNVPQRCWLDSAGWADRAACVSVGRGEQDLQRFLAVRNRRAAPDSARRSARASVTAAADLDRWASRSGAGGHGPRCKTGPDWLSTTSTSSGRTACAASWNCA
jgi:hypothetical protein